MQGATVLAPGHEGYVEPPLEQTTSDRTTDGAGTHDDEAHALHFAMRVPERRPGTAQRYVAMVIPPSTTTT